MIDNLKKMKYSITIETVENVDDEKYPRRNDVYNQVVDDLDIKKVICAVNNMENKDKLEIYRTLDSSIAKSI